MAILPYVLEKDAVIINQREVDGFLLQVKETNKYRWFEFGGSSIQSLMDKYLPEKILMPVSQALILFLLFKSGPLSVLNLGLGGACIDRALSIFPDINVTSVELSQPIINMAQQYFQLPSNIKVVCKEAELFINYYDKKSDIVICDLFIGESNPLFMFSNAFYKRLNQITKKQGLLSLNLKLKDNQQLLQLLWSIKLYFPYIIVVEFEDYSNIVLWCSKVEIESKSDLVKKLLKNEKLDKLGINKVLPKITYIPFTK